MYVQMLLIWQHYEMAYIDRHSFEKYIFTQLCLKYKTQTTHYNCFNNKNVH